MKLIFAILFSFCLNASAQYGQGWINVRDAPFSAPLGITLDASQEIQAAIDSAIEVGGGTVYIPKGSYGLSQPLIVAKWDSVDEEYEPVSVRIVGDDAMWSTTITRLHAQFKDGFVLGIQRGQGVQVSRLFFTGLYNISGVANYNDTIYKSPITYNADPTCRNTRYSPFAGIVIDPFSYTVPPDGGYPALTAWYRGSANTNGSRGVLIRDCSFNAFINAISISPNGVTKNAENILIKNNRVQNGLFAVSGSQEGEIVKIHNIGVWGADRAAFVWNVYGAQTAGAYEINSINLAGSVVDLVYRNSGGSFPLYLTNGFGESMGSWGTWYTKLKDVAMNNTIQLLQTNSSQNDGYRAPSFTGRGVSIFSAQTRYYGDFNRVLPLYNDFAEMYNYFPMETAYIGQIIGQYGSEKSKWRYGFGFSLSNHHVAPVNWYDSTVSTFHWHYARIQTTNTVDSGKTVIIMNEDSLYVGQGVVRKEIQGDYYLLGLISPFVRNDGRNYLLAEYAEAVIPNWRVNGQQ
jgi:hypothetical protein